MQLVALFYVYNFNIMQRSVNVNCINIPDSIKRNWANMLNNQHISPISWSG